MNVILISEIVTLHFSFIKWMMGLTLLNKLILALNKDTTQDQMATLIALKDSSPIEDAENIKKACKGYLNFSNFNLSLLYRYLVCSTTHIRFK